MFNPLSLVVFVIVGCVLTEASRSSPIRLAVSSVNVENKAIDWCPQCVNSFDELIDILLNIILQVGVLNTCGDLCNIVVDKTGSGFLGFLCDIGCDAFGIDEFIKAIEKADLDPIYYCEKSKLCPINDNGDAKFKTFTVLPARGPVGTTFNIDFTIVSNNGTGTGEIIITIDTVDKLDLTDGFLLEARKPGTFGEKITVDATPDPDCDPMQDQCEQWLPGRYNVTVLVCNGQCGSHHPHTQLYDTARGYFDIYE